MTTAALLKGLSSKLAGPSAFAGRFGESLWGALTFSPADDLLYPQKSVAIAIEKAGFSLACGSRFLSMLRIRGLARYDLMEGGVPLPEGLATSASLSLGKFRFGAAEATLSIPKEWAVMRTVEFPAAVKENLSNVISFELDRITPFGADEAYFDYTVLSESAERLTVLVIATRIETVQPYIDALTEKGVRVSRLTMDMTGYGTLCHFATGKPDSLFFEISDTSYRGAAFREGCLVASVAETLLISDERQQVERIVREISGLAEVLRKEGTDASPTILFRNAPPSLKETLRLSLGSSVTVLGETDLRIPIPESGRKDLSFAALGSLVESLWPGAKRYNLLSGGRHEVRKTPKALTIVLALAIGALLSVYAVAPVWVEGNKLQEIDRQIALRKDDVRKVEALKKEIDGVKAEIALIEGFKEGRPMTLSLLRELTTLLPKTAWLTRARITESGAEIEGYAASATELLPKLETSKYFQKVEFASPTFRDVRMNADRFIIKMEIEGVRKHEPEKAKGDKARSDKK